MGAVRCRPPRHSRGGRGKRPSEVAAAEVASADPSIVPARDVVDQKPVFKGSERRDFRRGEVAPIAATGLVTGNSGAPVSR